MQLMDLQIFEVGRQFRYASANDQIRADFLQRLARHSIILGLQVPSGGYGDILAGIEPSRNFRIKRLLLGQGKRGFEPRP